MQAEQSMLDRIQRRQLKWYGHLLRMEDKIVVGRRRFTIGHSTVGGEEKDRKKQVTDFMTCRNIEEYMAEDRHLWRLEMERWRLAV